MANASTHGPLQGLRLDTPQELPGISAVEIGATDRVLWDGARLFGDGRMDEYRSYLKKLREVQTDSAYAINFGMLRIDGDKEAFEDLAVEYAVNLGKSPPTWLEAHTVKDKNAGQTSIVRVKSLTAENIVETTISLESPWPTVIDLSEVSKVDNTGIELYNDCLVERIARKDKTRIINGEKLLRGFVEKVKTGKVSENAAIWAFCFSYFRIVGDKASFDTMAAEYTAKGGAAQVWSDESWTDDRTVDDKLASGFTAGKTLSAVNVDFANRLVREGLVQQAVKKGEPIVVDFTNMKGGSIFDMAHVNAFLKTLLEHNAKVSFVNVNEIVLSLMRIIGVDKFAKVHTPGTT